MNIKIVIPKIYREEIFRVAQDVPLMGHLGIEKTYQKLLDHFYWPTILKDVVYFVGHAPYLSNGWKAKSVPFDEPFIRIIIDCIGPLTKTKSGNEYILTILCSSTRFS